MENNRRIKVLAYGLFRGGEYYFRTTLQDLGIVSLSVEQHRLLIPGIALFKAEGTTPIAIRTVDSYTVITCDLLSCSRLAYNMMETHAIAVGLHPEVILVEEYGLAIIFLADKADNSWVRLHTGDWKDAEVNYNHVLSSPLVRDALGNKKDRKKTYVVRPSPESRWPTDEADEFDPYKDEFEERLGNIRNKEITDDDVDEMFNSYNLSGD